VGVKIDSFSFRSSEKGGIRAKKGERKNTRKGIRADIKKRPFYPPLILRRAHKFLFHIPNKIGGQRYYGSPKGGLKSKEAPTPREGPRWQKRA